MPLHERVCYQEEDGTWTTVYYHDLFSADVRSVLRTKYLYDSPEKTIEFGIRNREDSPHFYQKRGIRRNLNGRRDNSTYHDEQRDNLLKELQNYSKVLTGFYEFSKNQEKSFERISLLKDYYWAKEVTYSVSEKGYVRFDLFGQSKALSLTDKQPYFALEVVETHFSSLEAFSALLELSKKLPIVIGYFFIKKKNYFNKLDENTKRKSTANLRLTCYISDGDFWIRDERFYEGRDRPEHLDVYYNAVRETVTEKYM